MTAKTLLHRQYRLLAEQWPSDPLRPTLSLKTLLQQRLARLVPAAEGDAAQNHPEAAVAREVNVLGSLLEGRYAAKYPLSQRTLRPRGNPGYYDSLVRELEQAPGRSWWETKVNAWKGYIRMR